MGERLNKGRTMKEVGEKRKYMEEKERGKEGNIMEENQKGRMKNKVKEKRKRIDGRKE